MLSLDIMNLIIKAFWSYSLHPKEPHHLKCFTVDLVCFIRVCMKWFLYMARLHLLDDNRILWCAVVGRGHAPCRTWRGRGGACAHRKGATQSTGSLPTTSDLRGHTRFVAHQWHTRSALKPWLIEIGKKLQCQLKAINYKSQHYSKVIGYRKYYQYKLEISCTNHQITEE